MVDFEGYGNGVDGMDDAEDVPKVKAHDVRRKSKSEKEKRSVKPRNERRARKEWLKKSVLVR